MGFTLNTVGINIELEAQFVTKKTVSLETFYKEFTPVMVL